jgi:hypothetical protein
VATSHTISVGRMLSGRTRTEHFAKPARHDPHVTIYELVAIALLLVASATSRSKTPFCSLALLCTFVANLLYARDETTEHVRWISALVGLAGAVEFGMGVERTKRRKPVSIPDALRKVDAAAWIGVVLLASMGVDGFGMIVFRMFDVWIVPEATIGILVLVVGLGLFGKEIER